MRVHATCVARKCNWIANVIRWSDDWTCANDIVPLASPHHAIYGNVWMFLRIKGVCILLPNDIWACFRRFSVEIVTALMVNYGLTQKCLYRLYMLGPKYGKLKLTNRSLVVKVQYVHNLYDLIWEIKNIVKEKKHNWQIKYVYHIAFLSNVFLFMFFDI